MFISNISEDWSFFMTALVAYGHLDANLHPTGPSPGIFEIFCCHQRLTILHLFSNGMYMFFCPPLHPFFEFRFTKKIFSVFFTHSTIITVSIIYFVYYVKILTHSLYYFIIF